MKKVYIAIGSNMGDRHKIVETAINRIKEDKKISNVRISTLIETEPYGYLEQEQFLNGAIEITTEYTAQELLKKLQELEQLADRKRIVRWGPRTLDLDIIFYGDDIIDEENLKIPHYDMNNRTFVLEPLYELNKDYVHPVLNKTISEMLEDLKK